MEENLPQSVKESSKMSVAHLIYQSGGATGDRRQTIGVFFDLILAQKEFKKLDGNRCSEYELVTVPADTIFSRSEEKHHGYQR